MAFLDPYDLPPSLDDPEAFQAWLERHRARQAQPEAARISTEADEATQVINALQTQPQIAWPKEEVLPPLSHEEITSGLAFKVPEEQDFISKASRVLSAVKKGAMEGARVDEPIGSFYEPEVQSIQGLGPVTESVQDIARGFGRVADVSGRVMHGAFGAAQEGINQSLIEAGVDETSAGQLTRDLSLEVMRRQGGIGSPVRAKPFAAAKHILTKPEEAVVRNVPKDVARWVEENPNAKDVTPLPSEINLFSGATKIGKAPIVERVVDTPESFYVKKIVDETYLVGDSEVQVQYALEPSPTGGYAANIAFGVRQKGQPSSWRRKDQTAPTMEEGMATISTVIASVENFVRKVRPEKIRFTAQEDRLIPLYERFTRQLAKEHDGEVVPTLYGDYEVAFPRHAAKETILGEGVGNFAMLLGGSMGLAAFPWALRTFWSKAPITTSRVLPAEFGPSNLRIYDRASDIRKAYHLSPWTGLFANLRRRGFDNKAHFDAVEQNTNSALFTKVDAALSHGEMPGIDATYSSAVPAAKVYLGAKALPKEQYNLANDYLILLDISDRMYLAKASSGAGMTRKQINQKITAIEKLFPQVKDIQKDYETAMMAAVKYQSDGMYSTLGPKKTKEIMTNHRHLVPWEMDIVDPKLSLKDRLQARALSYGGKDPDLFTRTLLERKLSLSELPRVDAFDMLIRGTQMALRERTLNGVKGKSVEAYASTKSNAVVEITKKQESANPKWADRVFTVKQGGVKHRYISSSFISDVLRLDPHFAQSPLLWASNRAFQWGTTSYGAPWFALVQFVRENQLAPFNTPPGMKGIGVPYVQSSIGTASHFARASQKQLATEIYRNLDSGAGRVLRTAFAPIAAVRGISTEAMMLKVADGLSKSYTDSLTHLYHTRGGTGSTMTSQHVQYAKSYIDEALRDVNTPHSLRVLGETWKNMIDAFHGGAKYTMWVRNVKKAKKLGKGNISEDLLNLITRESRHLTGDLSQSGRFYPGAGRDITNANLLNSLELSLGGKAAEIMRENTIWFNALVKGFERMNRAYWDNPLQFVARVHTGVFMPTTLSVLSAMYLGKEYVDYMMQQRTEYEKATRLYIPIPGRPPEEGLWLPWAIEFAPLQYAYSNFLASTILGAEHAQEWAEVARVTMNNFFGLNLPPLFVAGVAATTGMRIPSTVPGIGEEAYSPRQDPYSALPGNTELFLRAAFGGVMDPFLGMINTLTKEQDAMGAIREAAYKAKQKTPLIGGGQLSSMNKVGQDFYRFMDKLTQMEEIYRSYYANPGYVQAPTTKAKKPKSVDDNIYTYGPEDKLIPDMIHGRTKTGKVSKKMVPKGDKEVLLPAIEKKRIGEDPDVLQPVNPVYERLAKGIHVNFEGKGNNWGKLMKRMSGITEHIQTLKSYNAGSMDKAKAYIDALPEGSSLKTELMQFDWSKRDSLRKAINYMEKERMKGFKLSKLITREVELRIKAQTGMDVKLEDLDPYEVPKTLSLGVGAP